MNDRELLELAAKAADIEFVGVVADGVPHRFGGGYWNPLTDDCDAFRLAHALPEPISIDVTKEMTIVSGWSFDLEEHHNDDPFAATRRAIVRAAAEIGKAMK
jgi:hypothetical protein